MKIVIKAIFLKQMLNILFNHHKDLLPLPKRKKICKFKNLVCTVQVKENYVVHVRTLKQDLNRGKVYRVIQFNQKAWLKPYVDMNTKKKKQKIILKKISLN